MLRCSRLKLLLGSSDLEQNIPSPGGFTQSRLARLCQRSLKHSRLLLCPRGVPQHPQRPARVGADPALHPAGFCLSSPFQPSYTVVFLLLFPPLGRQSAVKCFSLSEAFLGVPGGFTATAVSYLAKDWSLMLREIQINWKGFICPSLPTHASATPWHGLRPRSLPTAAEPCLKNTISSPLLLREPEQLRSCRGLEFSRTNPTPCACSVEEDFQNCRAAVPSPARPAHHQQRRADPFPRPFARLLPTLPRSRGTGGCSDAEHRRRGGCRWAL